MPSLSKADLADIGYTPVVELTPALSEAALIAGIRLFAKIEYNNPGLSHKDRIARSFVQEAINAGSLPSIGDDLSEAERRSLAARKPIVLASSGNTGNSVAWVGKAYGYDVIVITNAKCSAEKCADIRSKGAELKISDTMKVLGEKFLASMKSGDLSGLTRESVNEHGRKLLSSKSDDWSSASVADAQACIVTADLVSDDSHYGFRAEKVGTATKDYMEIENIMASLFSDETGEKSYFSIDQYGNQSNFNAHDAGLGPEIWEYDCNTARQPDERDGEKTRRVTDFLCVSSTGGTVTGVAHSLRRLSQAEHPGTAKGIYERYPLTTLVP
jgi:cysteine synthase